MREYYKKRAPVYDRVYSYSERQDDLRFLERYIPEQFVGKNVLEIAAGTGYWTQFISSSANSIVSTDVTVGALSKIKARNLKCPVKMLVSDAYKLDSLPNSFDAAFAGLWFSHISRQKIAAFLNTLHSKLSIGSTVVFIDNSKAQCDRLPLTHTDKHGNTYQDRPLDDGSIHRVLKNFPTEKELNGHIANIGTNSKYMELDNFWLFQYQTA